MKHTHRLMLTAIAALLPLSAAAYVSPDQYLYSGDYNLPPPTARHAYDRVQAQNALYAERRQQQNRTTTVTYNTSSGVPVIVPHDPGVVYALPQSGSNIAATVDDLTLSVDDLTDTVQKLQHDINANQRIENRVEDHWDAPVWKPAEVWHPTHLPKTGPGMWVAFGLVAAAAAWTLKRAKLVELA